MRFQNQDRSFVTVNPDEFYAFGYEVWGLRRGVWLRITFFDTQGLSERTVSLDHEWRADCKQPLWRTKLVRQYRLTSSEPFSVKHYWNMWWLWPLRLRKVLVVVLLTQANAFYVRRQNQVVQWHDALEREDMSNGKTRSRRRRDATDPMVRIIESNKRKFENIDGVLKKKQPRPLPGFNRNQNGGMEDKEDSS